MACPNKFAGKSSLDAGIAVADASLSIDLVYISDNRKVWDEVALTDIVTTTLGKSFVGEDDLTLTDVQILEVTKNISDSVSMTDSVRIDYRLTIRDTLNVTDKMWDTSGELNSSTLNSHALGKSRTIISYDNVVIT